MVRRSSTQEGTQAGSSKPGKRRRRRAQGEGAIYFDASRDRWVGQAWIDGRRRKVSAKREADCAAKLGALVHGGTDERHADRRATVNTLMADWQHKALPNRNLAPSTLEVHAWAAGLWCDRLGTVRLAELTVNKVERALARMADDGLSRASLVKARSTLRLALAWAQKRRVVAHNAAAVAELPRDAPDARSRQALTAAELQRLFDALDDHPWQAMFALMGRVGLRPGEAAGVCTDAIDIKSKPPTVSIVRGVQLTNGRPHLVDDLKTAGARRTLAIPRDVAAMLRAVLASQLASSGLLFRSADDGPVWPSTMRTELVAACVRAKVKKISPNELRHSAATILADSLPPHVVADILGHRSTKMIDATYRHRPPVILGAETH